MKQLRSGTIYTISEHLPGTEMAIRALYMLKPVVREEPTTQLGDILIASYDAKVRNIDGSESVGRFDCYESGLVILVMKDIRYGCTCPEDLFEALRQVRIEMEKDGRIPLVNGANRNACSRGTAGDMAGGLSFYLVTPDDPCVVLVETFESDHVTDPVFVAEQDLFRSSWMNQSYASDDKS